MPSTPDVSVIVIGYNDAARLPTAVRSVLRQTLRNLEVVIVDDGSTDETPEVVAAFCATDTRVRSVRLSTNSGGCGAPRNAGIDAARADDVMFLDSDDRYQRHACKNLLEAREDAEADFAMGLVRRFHTDTRVNTSWYQPLFDERRVVHGIAEDPELIRDTLSVNKLFRRTFLDEIDLRFPVDLHYEDQLFTIQAYHRARRIAVIPEHVYTWRVFGSTDHGDSITNQRHRVANIRSRVAVNRRIDDYLDGHGATELLHLKRNKFLEHDMRLYLQEIIRRDPSLVFEVLAEAEPYLRSIPTDYFLALPHALRAAYGMALRGDLAGLRQAMLIDRMNVVGARFVQHEGHVFLARSEPIRCPGASSPIDPDLDPEAPENLLLQVDDMPLLAAPFGTFHLHSEITGSSLRRGHLRLTGFTSDTLGKLDDSRDWRIGLVARRARHGALVRLRVILVRHDDGRLAWHVAIRTGSPLFRRVTRARWELSVETRIGDRSIRSPLLWPVHLSPTRVPVAPLSRLVLGATASLGPDAGGLAVLEVRSSFGRLRRWVPTVIRSLRYGRARLARATSRPQKRLRDEVVYPALRRVPLNPRLAVFESNRGTVYGDSPKYVYQAMRRLRPDLECVWVLPAGGGRPDADVEVVQRGTLDYPASPVPCDVLGRQPDLPLVRPEAGRPAIPADLARDPAETHGSPHRQLPRGGHPH